MLKTKFFFCKDKDEVIAHYALEGYNNPLGVSEYELSKLFPKDFKSTLPSIDDIEKVLFLQKNDER